ncbi:MAG: UxaA family hydrolase [bacterium]|jgi:altronate dehydratase small subunit
MNNFACCDGHGRKCDCDQHPDVNGGFRQQVALVLNPKDNVATVICRGLQKGEQVNIAACSLTVLADIPFGHKISLAVIPQGAYVYKYGEIIGRAKQDINPGEHVHTHNVEDIVDLLRHEVFSKGEGE